ncbi:hypothetical protein AC1031_021457 [Aphanomyces cochlioides]|nr:hypothetical protein AC1031_021457 [Aphanomyces cochlioides]
MEITSETSNGQVLKKRKTQGKKRVVWDEVASFVGTYFVGLDIDGRRCRERCMLLSDAYAKHQKSMERMSGVEEEVAEIDEYLAEILELREEESHKASSKKIAIKSKEQIEQDIGMAIRDKAMKAMGQRKTKVVSSKVDAELLEMISRREANAKEIEEKRLKIEERRVAIEEKRAAHEEQRYELDKNERLALLNLINKLADKLT